MASSSVADDITSDTEIKVKYLQKKLSAETPPDNHLIMKILKKLCQLPVTVAILQDTGIGKDINSLKKQEGKIGSLARDLVQKWKTMVRTANREHKITPSGTHRSHHETSHVSPKEKVGKKAENHRSSSEPKSNLGRIPKIKVEKDSDSQGNDTKVHQNKSSGQQSKAKSPSESKKKDIHSQSPTKRKVEDSHKQLTPKKVKKDSEKTEAVSPNRGLMVETVYAGSPRAARLNSSYNDFMQNTTTQNYDSESEDSDRARSHSLDKVEKKQTTRDKEVDRRVKVQGSVSDSEDSVSDTEHPLDKVNKKKQSPRKRSQYQGSSEDSVSDTEHPLDRQSRKRASPKKRSKHRNSSGSSLRSSSSERDDSDVEQHQNGAYSSDSSDSFSTKTHPLERPTTIKKEKSDDSGSELSDGEKHYSDSGDSLIGTAHPLDQPKKMKKEISSDSDSDSKHTKLKNKPRSSSKNAKVSIKKEKVHHRSKNVLIKKEKDYHRTKSESNANKVKVESKSSSAKSENIFDSIRKSDSHNKKSHSSSSSSSQIKKETEDAPRIKSETLEGEEKSSLEFDSSPLAEDYNTFADLEVVKAEADDSAAVKKEETDDSVNKKSESLSSEKKPPVKPKKKKKMVDTREKTFENTGMSFADCLGALFPVKKVKRKPAAKPPVAKPTDASKQSSDKTDQKGSKIFDEKVASSEKKVQSHTENESNLKQTDGKLHQSANKSSSSTPDHDHKSNKHNKNSNKASSSTHDKSKTDAKDHEHKTLHHSSDKSASKKDHHQSKSHKSNHHANSENGTASYKDSRITSDDIELSDDEYSRKDSHHVKSSGTSESKTSHSDHSKSKMKKENTKDSHSSSSSHHSHSTSKHKSDKSSSHRSDRTTSSHKSSSHKDKQRSHSSKSSKTSSDKHHKEKHHHSSSSSTHKKNHHHESKHERKSSEVAFDSASTEMTKSREEMRKERKRKWSTSGDEAISISPKPKKDTTAVSLNLPDIQPDYKPVHMPIIEPREKKEMKMDDPTRMIGSRLGNRTKVFSGRVRTHYKTDVPRLFDVCMEVLCANIDALDEVGGVPADILRPVLERCTPQQLFHLEDVNPHFLEDTDDLWRKHAERDFRNKQPDEFENWREFFIRKYDEREARLKSLSANIKASMAAKDPGRLTKMAFMDGHAKPPRSVKRAQNMHGTHTGDFVPRPPCSSASKEPKDDLRDTDYRSSSSRSSLSGGGALGRSVSLQRAKPKTIKVVAPIMQKSLKLFKKTQSRR